MAKKIVKCLYCGQPFDANAEPFVKPRSNRYAHLKCHEERDKLLTQEQLEQEKFYEECKKIFGKSFDYIKTKRLAEMYIKKYEYTWSGMTRTLEYFYVVKKNPIAKANGSIGIIPYEYQHAYNYYYEIWRAQQLNVNKKIEDYIPEVIEVTIPPPQPKLRKRRLFSFLDKEDK